jgi:hypothetical protein
MRKKVRFYSFQSGWEKGLPDSSGMIYGPGKQRRRKI